MGSAIEIPEWVQMLMVAVTSSAILWLFTTATRNRERIVKLETEVKTMAWTLHNIDTNVDLLVKAEAKRQGREDAEDAS